MVQPNLPALLHACAQGSKVSVIQKHSVLAECILLVLSASVSFIDDACMDIALKQCLELQRSGAAPSNRLFAFLPVDAENLAVYMNANTAAQYTSAA